MAWGDAALEVADVALEVGDVASEVTDLALEVGGGGRYGPPVLTQSMDGNGEVARGRAPRTPAGVRGAPTPAN
jgi:hypothetical protein